jgi:hypothetical protein
MHPCLVTLVLAAICIGLAATGPARTANAEGIFELRQQTCVIRRVSAGEPGGGIITKRIRICQ